MGYGVIILAAGHGKRMQSGIPKVLHKLANNPIIIHSLGVVIKLPKVQQIIIVAGSNQAQLQAVVNSNDLPPEVTANIGWANQLQPLGTADAVRVGLTAMSDKITQILVLSGDVPLISQATLENLIAATPESAIGLITAKVTDPSGLGRIIRDAANNFVRIVEDADADHAMREIKEINGGVYLFPRKWLAKFLPQIDQNNQQQEYYLTALFDFIQQQQMQVRTHSPVSYIEIVGVNTREQLAMLEREYQLMQAKQLLRQGVTLIDPRRFDVRGDVNNINIAEDVTIDINVILDGLIKIGTGTVIGPNCYIKDATIGNNVEVLANTVIEGAVIADGAKVGPFARIRPKTIIASQAKVGNFVEVKAATIGEYSKVNHLSYVGNANIGSKVNFGAGSITCNYDGANKYQTIIEDYAAIGAGCQLIAPITVAANATIAAGTTVITDAPAAKLTLNKKLQYSVEWQRPVKVELGVEPKLEAHHQEILDK